MRLFAEDALLLAGLHLDHRKLTEATLMCLHGHTMKAFELFTRERIFWLMDDHSLMMRPPEEKAE